MIKPCKLGCQHLDEIDAYGGWVVVYWCNYLDTHIGYDTGGDLLDPPGCEHWSDGSRDARAVA